MKDRVQSSRDPVGLIFWEYDLASVSARMKSLEDTGNIVLLISICLDNASLP